MSKNLCTYTQTGNGYQQQFYRRCSNCFINPTEGACLSCCVICHAGHDLGPLLYGNFFCDCYNHKTCCLNGKNTFNPNNMSNSRQLVIFDPSKIKYANKKNEYVDKGIERLVHKLFPILPDNQVFSPLSLGMILAFLQIGAQSETKLELIRLFHWEYSASDLMSIDQICNNPNTKYVQMTIISDKIGVNSLYKYMFNCCQENFQDGQAVCDKMNKYIADQTNNLITDVLQASTFSPNTMAVCLNVIYFKSDWFHPFKEYLTENKKFVSCLDQHECQVPMMHQMETFRYFENDAVQMIELPYVVNDYVMGIILQKATNRPFNETRDVLLKHNHYTSYMYPAIINLSLPKFTQRTRHQMIPYLEQCGVNALFDPDKANLSNICLTQTQGQNCYISQIIHETVVIVNEYGTEASAINFAQFDTLSADDWRPKRIEFCADHSFIYYIKHVPSDMLLFIGDYHGSTESYVQNIPLS
jgi:serine protease inhibitor